MLSYTNMVLKYVPIIIRHPLPREKAIRDQTIIAVYKPITVTVGIYSIDT